MSTNEKQVDDQDRAEPCLRTYFGGQEDAVWLFCDWISCVLDDITDRLTG